MPGIRWQYSHQPVSQVYLVQSHIIEAKKSPVAVWVRGEQVPLYAHEDVAQAAGHRDVFKAQVGIIHMMHYTAKVAFCVRGGVDGLKNILLTVTKMGIII